MAPRRRLEFDGTRQCPASDHAGAECSNRLPGASVTCQSLRLLRQGLLILVLLWSGKRIIITEHFDNALHVEASIITIMLDEVDALV